MSDFFFRPAASVDQHWQDAAGASAARNDEPSLFISDEELCPMELLDSQGHAPILLKAPPPPRPPVSNAFMLLKHLDKAQKRRKSSKRKEYPTVKLLQPDLEAIVEEI
jgi:hypothetical protein